MLIAQAAAQPLPAASVPRQMALSTARSASEPQAVTVPVSPGVTALTVQLQPAPKTPEWSLTDPAVWTPILALATIISAQWITWRQLKTQRLGTDKQLAEAARNTEKQLTASREAANRQALEAREQASLSRTLESRKDLFSQFIDDFKLTASMIGKLPDRDLLKNPDLEELQNMNATVNKIWLWASPETVYEVRVMQTETNELAMEGVMNCRPIHRVMDDIRRAEARLQKLEVERDGHLQAIRNFRKEVSPSGIPTMSNMASEMALHSALKHAQDGIKAGHEELQPLHAENVRLRKEYLAFVTARSSENMKRLTNLMGLARKELQVPGDTAVLDLQTDEIRERVAALSKRVREELEQ